LQSLAQLIHSGASALLTVSWWTCRWH